MLRHRQTQQPQLQKITGQAKWQSQRAKPKATAERRKPSHLNPAVLRIPATTPTATAAAGEKDKFAAEPIATPPARVAFWIWTMLNLPLKAEEEAKAAIAAPSNAIMVFITQRNCR